VNTLFGTMQGKSYSLVNIWTSDHVRKWSTAWAGLERLIFNFSLTAPEVPLALPVPG
jgi:hypothetical protein